MSKQKARRERGRVRYTVNVAELTFLECFQLRIKRATERVSSAIQQMIRPAESAESASLALQSVNHIGFCIADLPKAKARASHAGCAGCLNYDNNPYLACTIHPLGRPGYVCGDWEDGWTKERVWPQLIAEQIDPASGTESVVQQLIYRGQVLAEVMSDGYINHFADIPKDASFGEVRWSAPTAPAGGPTNSPEHEPGGCDRGGV
jgi:hypothetical protein